MRIIDRDLTQLRTLLLRMGQLAEQAINQVTTALLDRDDRLAEQVIIEDDEIDLLENEVDRLATDVMVLRQPAAGDLRFTVTSLHTAPVIERIADHAVNIAKHVKVLNQAPKLKEYVDLPRMSALAQQMVHQSLESLTQNDIDLARRTIAADDQVDDLFHQIYDEVILIMQRDPQTIPSGVELLFIIKHLERIADYATNICEMVIYMVEGRVIKHTSEAQGL
jgi:phosphate transport system protein